LLRGNERSEDLTYPDREYKYFLFADRFGWTPLEVDEQPAELLDWLIAISGVVEEVKAERMESKS
jgi:hypothetical protein